MTRTIHAYLTVLFVVCVISPALCAAEWGDLSGQIVFDGPVPVPEKAKITSDREVCCEHDVVDESLLVDPKTKGVRNVVIALTLGRTDKRQVPIHESYEALKQKPVEFENLGCRFEPHVALIWTARKVLIGNPDPIGHNVNFKSTRGEGFNENIPTGDTVEKSFTISQKMPIAINCSIHPWMNGWALIRDNPYMAVTAADGKFEIKNLPVGTWEFMFWQEAAGYVSDVQRNGQPVEWKRGILEIEIKPGKNDLGKIVVKPDLFEK